ncbi:dolichyl-diphosphooligosaccharide--protein glycosyltransferase subunit DAD1, putative [Plasmodium malariae]|uniref:Dolichyl-diphosphooligosaccharide--protein glycosyltransferase subunit DAD1, putative n=1 Tax=Plasmodium malariae TaxID=5858 RepID=A0A1C3K9S3_PLAMA|nr:dolichyl-diphosphooligosaccharide--protein glycosyltransferase subunit DAD1, putative [Plasmodium malariae]
MNRIVNTFYRRYKKSTLRIALFIDIFIIFTFSQLIILWFYAYLYSSFDDKIVVAAIFTAIGNVTFLGALREQITNKSLFNLKREKIIFDFVLCSLLLYIGVFSYMHLN